MKNKKFILAIAIFVIFSFLICFPLTAEEISKPVDLKNFPEWVKKIMAEEKVPGMAVAIVKDGKIIFAEGFGVRGIKEKKPVTANTLFAIGSTSLPRRWASWSIKASWIGIHPLGSICQPSS